MFGSRSQSDYKGYRLFLLVLAAVWFVGVLGEPAQADSYGTSTENEYLYETVSASPLHNAKLFHTMEIGVGDPLRYLQKAAVLEKSVHKGIKGTGPAIEAWSALIEAAQNQEPVMQVQMINAFFNQVRYVGEAPGQDVWETPVEFLNYGGDCEDYAIAKYVSLRLLGWSKDRLRMVLLNDSITGLQHAVLTVNYGGEAYVLDNLNRNILTVDQIDYYHPLASLNESRLWVHWVPGDRQNSVAAIPQILNNKG
jgi:predicted transglutaminase-like cysteine proteinase